MQLMNKPIFCFFHVGSDSSCPQMLVDSIRKFNPISEIVYCTDSQSPNINGVTHRLEFQGNPDEIMAFRLKSFANSGIEGPAVYLDTDMLCIKSFDPVKILESKDLYICERSFNKEALFNGNFNGMNYLEYDQMPLSEVYPYLACTTITRNSEIWIELADLCDGLSEKFRIWYGDQEALKIIARRKSKEQLGFIPEHTYACLPENINYATQATFLHFKGPARKILMIDFYKQIMCS
jgi:hypothetical protein